MAGIGQDLKKIYSDETRIVENASLWTVLEGVNGLDRQPHLKSWGRLSAGTLCRRRHDVWVTSDDDPERNDILRLEDDVRASSDDPEHNDILQLDEVKRRKSMLINTY